MPLKNWDPSVSDGNNWPPGTELWLQAGCNDRQDSPEECSIGAFDELDGPWSAIPLHPICGLEHDGLVPSLPPDVACGYGGQGR